MSFAVIYGFDIKKTLKIAECESGFSPTVKNINPETKTRPKSTDIGVFQINEYYHSKEARLNGLDITNPKDNITMAFILMKKNQFSDWSASKSCWSGVS